MERHGKVDMKWPTHRLWSQQIEDLVVGLCCLSSGGIRNSGLAGSKIQTGIRM